MTSFIHRPCNHATLLLAVLLLTSLTSCMDLYDIDGEPIEYDVYYLELSRHEVNFMAGDKYELKAVVGSASENYELYWFTDYEGIDAPVTLYGPQLCANAVGSLYAYVAALPMGEAKRPEAAREWSIDSCQINVFRWPEAEELIEHPQDMVIYANITIDGVPLNPAYQEVAALIDGQVYGRGLMYSDYGIEYWRIRIWRDQVDLAPIQLQIYDHHTCQLYSLTSPDLLFDGERHGTISSLVSIVAKSK